MKNELKREVCKWWKSMEERMMIIYIKVENDDNSWERDFIKLMILVMTNVSPCSAGIIV